MFYDQHEWNIRCEWGMAGISHLLPVTDVVIIVDVLSFSTCVAVAVGNGALVYPYRWKDAAAAAYAESRGAVLASWERTQTTGYSLAPSSLVNIPAATRLVLPSPNGATLSLATGDLPTLAGCLRNAAAVACKAQQIGQRVTVIPAGERWPDGSLRPALEDLLGAGAIIHALQGSRSPEAMAAEHAFLQARLDLQFQIEHCSSGKQLIEHGFAEDVVLAAALNHSDRAPLLKDGAYVGSY